MSDQFPNIGADPLKFPDQNFEAGIDRLRAAVARQQTEVPDQTMLAWRIDVSRLIDELVWRRCHLPIIQRQEREIERLKRGDFSPAEFQTLCHNLNEMANCTPTDFFDGCALYQKQLLGRSEREEKDKRIAELEARVFELEARIANALI